METVVKVVSYKTPSLWRIKGHSKLLKGDKQFHVACFEPGTAIDWVKSIVAEDFKVSSVHIVGNVEFVSELEGPHHYYALSFKQSTRPSVNSWYSTERSGVSAQNLIQAGAVLLQNKPNAVLLSINHVGQIDAILDVRIPQFVIPSETSS